MQGTYFGWCGVDQRGDRSSTQETTMSQPPQLAPAQSTADPIPATDGTPLVSLGPPVAPDILHQAGAIAEEFGRAGVSPTAVEAALSRRRSRRRVIQFYSALAIIYIAVFGVGFDWVAWWNVVGKPIPEWAEMSWSQWPVSYTHLRAHETDSYLVCRLLL